MPEKRQEGRIIAEMGVIETRESDNVLHWDGDMLYVEEDVYHNGQLVHRRYRKRVTREVAEALRATLAMHS